MSGLLLKLFAASLLLPPPAAVGPPVMRARGEAQDGRSQGCDLPTASRKVDEYGALPADEERPRLEKLAAALDAEPEDTKAFIVAYAGRAARAGEALTRADRAKQTLIEKGTVYNTRVNTLDCGRREAPSMELWLTPAGASPPRCSPTLDPTPAPAKGGTVRRPPRRRSGRL